MMVTQAVLTQAAVGSVMSIGKEGGKHFTKLIEQVLER